MKLEKQVCSIAQAKKLKTLGIVQESLYYITEEDNGTVSVVPEATLLDQLDDIVISTAAENSGSPSQYSYSKAKVREYTLQTFGALKESREDAGIFSAYTVAELGAMLAEASEGVVFTDFKDWLTHWDDNLTERFPTEAQARAALLIDLLERGELQAEEYNARLSAA